MPVNYPFGYGLSYTTFEYDNLQVKPDWGDVYPSSTPESMMVQRFAQLYVGLPGAKVFRPVKELKGFSKVFLKAGEEKTVTIKFDDKTFRYWNMKTNKWEVEGGVYSIMIGASCADIRLQDSLAIIGTTEVMPYYTNRVSSYVEGKIQQIGTPEDIYNEPKNAFVADFIGESNIFKGIMTGHMKVRFCGGEFTGMDDVPEGTLVDVVVRPEDVIITAPQDGTVAGVVTSVIFKGMHYEVAVESGKYEIIIRTTKCYAVGDEVGICLEPDGIHVMLAEDHTTSFVTTINSDYTLDFNGKVIRCDLTKVVPKSRMKDNALIDENGETVDISKLKVQVSIQPDDIEMSDEAEAGLVSGEIINLIYKGDHYSYVVRTEYGHDLIVDDEYLWNMNDKVSLVMPEDKMKFQLKK